MRKIKQYQIDHGLSQTDLSHIWGVSISHVSMVCNGVRMPSLPLAVKIEKSTQGFVLPRDWVEEAEL